MKTAAETYTETQAHCGHLLKRIEGALADHARRAATQPRSWAWHGDLSHVSLDLLRTLDFLGALAPEEREKHAAVL